MEKSEWERVFIWRIGRCMVDGWMDYLTYGGLWGLLFSLFGPFIRSVCSYVFCSFVRSFVGERVNEYGSKGQESFCLVLNLQLNVTFVAPSTGPLAILAAAKPALLGHSNTEQKILIGTFLMIAGAKLLT